MKKIYDPRFIGGCLSSCSKCLSSENLTKHHIKPKRDGGKTTPENIIILCRECHDKVHAKGIKAEALKCCGNCKHYHNSYCFTEKNYYCAQSPHGIKSKYGANAIEDLEPYNLCKYWEYNKSTGERIEI